MLKEFKNGNIHIKLEKSDSGSSIIEKLYYNYDIYPVGEEYCLSNYATAIDWCYNGGSAYYRITSIDLQELENNRTVISHPLKWTYIEEFLLNKDY